MLKTYEQLWPFNPFLFLIPFQEDKEINSHRQNIQMIRSPRSIVSTVNSLLDAVSDDEWVYWCLDDKFLLAIDAESASYFAKYVCTIEAKEITGLSFCRARYLLVSPHVSKYAVGRTGRGDSLLVRTNYNQIWLHQFIRARALRNLFNQFPARDFGAIEMDTFTRQGPNALRVPREERMFVTERNFVVFGESTIGGNVTRGCVESMSRFGIVCPNHFGILDVNIVIGSLGNVHGE
jgi:hypothetical protein